MVCSKAVSYTHLQTSAEGSATVTYDNATAKVSDENADYVANYDVSFAIADGSATISNGTVTGVKIETTGKTEYTHGDSVSYTHLDVYKRQVLQTAVLHLRRQVQTLVL